MKISKLFPARARQAGSPVEPVDADDELALLERLVQQERFTEAVDHLAEVNHRRRDPGLDIRLVELRHIAARSMPIGPGRSPWPPAYEDPFPEVAGRLPEVEAGGLTTGVLGGAVAHHGGLVVRNALSDASTNRIADAIERTHRHRSGETVEGEAGALDGPAWYRRFDTGTRRDEVLRRMVAEQGGTWLADSPASTALVLHELTESGVVPAIAGHLGERPFFSVQKSTLRRSLPTFNYVAWHQDGSFLDDDVRTMNVWVALSACGGDHPSPGMELIPRRFDEILPVDGVMSPHSISYDLIDELAAETPTVVPEFAPGDAMLFDERFVHRTHLDHGMSEIRYALECWFFAPSHQSNSGQSSTYLPLLA